MSTARIRATIQLRETPLQTAPISESLGAGTPVDILDDQGAWLKVQASESSHAISGWLMREGLAFPPREDGVFPMLSLSTGKSYTPVPRSLKANDLLTWKAAPENKPHWIPDTIWNTATSGEREKVKDGIRNALQTRQTEWDAWMADVTAAGRQNEASLEEWLVTLQGGRDVWSWRAEMIYTEASQTKGHLGWVAPNDIMLWTGKVRRNDQESKYKIWYEVVLYKSGKLLKGWFKGDLVETYVHPTKENDVVNESNAANQFDLTKPILRHPADSEIQDAINAGRAGYQYLDIAKVIGVTKIHYNLCGMFCAAALAGVDVIPLLQQWKAAYPNADKILRNNSGTGLTDVESMLKIYGLEYETLTYDSSISSITPARLLERVEKGNMVFWGVAIFKSNGKLSGKVAGDKTTRHWIVLEDVHPVGNSGWVRIYNPFRNREEIYTYDYFMLSVGQFGLGLLVDVPKNVEINTGGAGGASGALPS